MDCNMLAFPVFYPSSGVCSNSCPLSWWCHPTISSSVVPFSSCLQSFPASGSFSMSQFFTSGGQSIGASASSVLCFIPVRIAIIKKSTKNKLLVSVWRKGTLISCWWECKLVQPLWRRVWRFRRNTNNRTTIWSSNSTLGHIFRKKPH